MIVLPQGLPLKILILSCLLLSLTATTAIAEDQWGNQSLAVATSAGGEYTVELPGGWNLFSTPVLLEGKYASFSGIFDASQQENIDLLFGWTGERWYIPAATDRVGPLEAYYVRVADGRTVTATIIPSGQISIPPSRQLRAGRNLVGPAPAYDSTLGIFPPILLTDALASAREVGTLPGYKTVISPGLGQPGWVYSPGSAVPDLLPNKGYWVIMENGPDTLFGYSTTPVG